MERLISLSYNSNIEADKYQYLLLPQPNISEQQEIIDAIKKALEQN